MVIECFICNNFLDDDEFKPVSGTCGHTICIKCCRAIANRKCPTCQREHSFRDETVNFQLIDLINSVKDKEAKQVQKEKAEKEKLNRNFRKCCECGLLMKKEQSRICLPCCESLYIFDPDSETPLDEQAKSFVFCGSCSLEGVHNEHKTVLYDKFKLKQQAVIALGKLVGEYKTVTGCSERFQKMAKSPPPPPPPPPPPVPPVQAKRNKANNRLSNAANNILEESRMERYCIRTDMVEKGKLGRGALGTAVLVQLHDNPTLMVVKKFNGQQSLYVDEMHKELSKLVECGNHTHIVQLYGLVCEDEQKTIPIGILMEHMDCGSLHDFIHLSNEPYGEKEVLDWGRQAASALHHLHRQKLIHRDIKSDNILLTRVDGKKQLKIADFGMVSRDKAELQGSPKSLCGTPYYLAPEGYPWHPGDCTSAMDIYSLGITLWEMAQRMRPYNADNLVFEDEKRTIKRPSLENPAYCWLPGLVKRMWAEDASARPTASEVYAELNELYRRFK